MKEPFLVGERKDSNARRVVSCILLVLLLAGSWLLIQGKGPKLMGEQPLGSLEELSKMHKDHIKEAEEAEKKFYEAQKKRTEQMYKENNEYLKEVQDRNDLSAKNEVAMSTERKERSDFQMAGNTALYEAMDGGMIPGRSSETKLGDDREWQYSDKDHWWDFG